MTSNVEAIHKLWNFFTYPQMSNNGSSSSELNLWTRSFWNTYTKDRKNVLYWSAQAYIINKNIIRPFIDDVIDIASNNTMSYKIINSFNPKKCNRTKIYPCILSNCLFSDSYIYSGGGPTYVLNFPLFNGDIIGYDSTIHQEQVRKSPLIITSFF